METPDDKKEDKTDESEADKGGGVTRMFGQFQAGRWKLRFSFVRRRDESGEKCPVDLEREV